MTALSRKLPIAVDDVKSKEMAPGETTGDLQSPTQDSFVIAVVSIRWISHLITRNRLFFLMKFLAFNYYIISFYLLHFFIIIWKFN